MRHRYLYTVKKKLKIDSTISKDVFHQVLTSRRSESRPNIPLTEGKITAGDGET